MIIYDHIYTHIHHIQILPRSPAMALPSRSFQATEGTLSCPNIEMPRSTSMTLSFCGVVTMTAAVILRRLQPSRHGTGDMNGKPW